MLDASIYNQKPQSFADAMGPWVQLATAKQNIENMQAENPGIVARSQEAARIAARNADVQKITSQFKGLDTEGKATFDTKGASTALAGAGYWQEASQIAKDVLDQHATDLQNKFNEGANPITLQKARKTLDDESITQIANIADQIKDPGQRSEFLQNAIPQAVQRYGINPDDPRVGAMIKGGTTAVANVGATPQARQELAVSQGNLALAQQGQGFNFASAGFTPEGKDPNSQVSRQARQIAQQAGLPVTDNMSLFDMNRIPGFAQALGQAQGAQIAPAGVRAEAVGAAATQQTTAEMLAEAAKSTRGFSKDLIGTRLGTIGGTAWQKYVTQEPRLAALGTQIQTYNSQFPNDPIDPSKLSLGEIGAKLEAGSKMLGARAKGSAKIAETQRLPSTQPAGGNNVMMINPKTGRQGPVPADQVQNLLAKGYKKL